MLTKKEKKEFQNALKEKQQQNMTLLKSQKKALKEKEKKRMQAAKQREAAIDKKNAQKKKQLAKEAAPKTAQQTIRYKLMFSDGICQVTDNLFSKTLKFTDINYFSAQSEQMIAIFEKYCEILNYFDSNVNVQLSVINRKIDKEDFKRSMLIKMQGDELDEYRQEYNQMLLNKALQGQNSIIKDKYITVAVEADSYEDAKPTLMRLETDVTNMFKSLGCSIDSLSGEQRLNCVSGILNPNEPLKFDYDMLIGTGLTTKDFIAPYDFNFAPIGEKQILFEMGDYFAQGLVLTNYPADLYDKLIKDLADVPCNLSINIHTNAVDNAEALEVVQRKIAFMEQDKANQQQKLIKQMVDPDMITQSLKHNLEGSEALLNNLQNNNQRMFKTTVIVFASAKTKQQLKDNVEKLKAIARSNSCELRPLAYEQEAALNAALPLGKCDINIRRTQLSASQGALIPFTTQELFEENGFYCGLNAISHNLIFLNRKALQNPAGFVLGTPGSGKSFAVKRELVNVILATTDDEVLVIDPESEYIQLCKALGGEVIKISSDTDTYFNPLDITMNYSDENILSAKTEFIFSVLDVMCRKESGNGLTGGERTLVDIALKDTYAQYFKKPTKGMPTLVDFYNALRSVKEQELAAEKENMLKVLGLYTTGSFNLFAHRTNVNIDNRFVVFDIKELGDQLKTLGMLVILDQIWNRVTSNRLIGRRTWIAIDEAHLLFSNPFAAQFLSSLWKRARKYGGICTGITQNVQEMLDNELAKMVLSNSQYILMLNQHPADAVLLADMLNLSQEQISSVTNANSGSGLLVAGSAVIQFIDQFPKDTKLYKMMTTKPEEQNSNQA